MTRYVPFLKSKSNEIIALGELSHDVRSQITPFFDYPRNKNGYSEDSFKSSLKKIIKSFKKHISDINELYFDNYDIGDSLQIDGEHNYKYLLNELRHLSVIPVISIDRSTYHMQSVIDLKDNNTIDSDVIAIRLTPEDFESFGAIKDEIEDILGDTINKFNEVDLIFDCRICNNLNSGIVSNNITNFKSAFTSKYNTRRIIITGSSIPASIRDLIRVDEEGIFQRNEFNIYNNAKISMLTDNLVFGDYATVSPNYSEVDIIPEAMQNITTAKLIYSFGQSLYVIRGGSIKVNGFGQYFDLARELCSKAFFRGSIYSIGDDYFFQKSNRIGNNCTPAAVVKPSVNAHITYMVKDAPI